MRVYHASTQAMKTARIVAALAEMTGLSVEEAMRAFYNSQTFELIQDGVADLHCRSDRYLAEETALELGLSLRG